MNIQYINSMAEITCCCYAVITGFFFLFLNNPLIVRSPKD